MGIQWLSESILQPTCLSQDIAGEYSNNPQINGNIPAHSRSPVVLLFQPSRALNEFVCVHRTKCENRPMRTASERGGPARDDAQESNENVRLFKIMHF
jgi:hypothetical protein